jgi:pyrophosphatase PpaX
MPNAPVVLFDLDGTLIDSVRLILDSYAHTLRVHGLPPLSEAEWLAGLGTPLVKQFARYDDGKGSIQALIQTYREYNLTHHDSMVTIYPGVRAMMETIRSRGWATGLVTSKNRAGAERGLRLVGLEGTLDVVVGADDVVKPKPDPEPVHKALALLGRSPEDAWFVGDSVHDMHAGNAAGVATVAVLWGPFSREELVPSVPNHWIDAPDQLVGVIDGAMTRG